MVLAWIACAAGIAAGALGCCSLLTNPRRDDVRSVAPQQSAGEPDVWVGLVGATAHDAIGTLRRLASRAQPVDTTALHDELRDVAARFRALRNAQPPRMVDGAEFARLLDIAATGAAVEADRLAGSTVVRNDRRAFLGAVRALRALPEHTGATTAARRTPAASGDVSPTFTVA